VRVKEFWILKRLGHITELFIVVITHSHKHCVRISTIALFIVFTPTRIIFLTLAMLVFFTSSINHRQVRLLLFFHRYRIAHHFTSLSLRFFKGRISRLSNRKIESRLWLCRFEGKDLKELRF